jgi:hypothetical protein
MDASKTIVVDNGTGVNHLPSLLPLVVSKKRRMS